MCGREGCEREGTVEAGVADERERPAEECEGVGGAEGAVGAACPERDGLGRLWGRAGD